jgi:UTP-glucose-1-phosphate uridylyltransferase
VEETLSAGIEKIIIIVQENDLSEFCSFFEKQVSIENYNKLPHQFQEYARRILEIEQQVSFVTQTGKDGFLRLTIEGQRYDKGFLEYYLDTMHAYSGL